jgi:hypothetical protein
MELKASDLRVGNWLQYKNIDKQFQVFIIDTTETSTQTNAKPIPLTEEWLFKMGFEKSTNEFGGYLSPVFLASRIRIQVTVDGLHHWQNSCFETLIPHVHSLQNLWKALTNTELIIK